MDLIRCFYFKMAVSYTPVYNYNVYKWLWQQVSLYSNASFITSGLISSKEYKCRLMPCLDYIIYHMQNISCMTVGKTYQKVPYCQCEPDRPRSACTAIKSAQSLNILHITGPQSVLLSFSTLRAKSANDNLIIQSTLVISNSLISNNRLSRSENLVPVLIQRSTNRQQNIVEKRRNCSLGAISPLFHNIFNIS